MVRVLSDDDVAGLLDLPALLDVVADAFRKQYRGEVERPERPHFPVGIGLDAAPDDPAAAPDDSVDADEPMGTALTMPAYVHGAEHYATKLVAVHEGNADRGLPTVNAQIVLSEAATGLPAALAAGTRVTNARTGCIGGLAARELAGSGHPDDVESGDERAGVDLAILGAGTQARWQARAIAAATEVASIRVYSPSDSKEACAADLEAELGVPATAAESPAAAVEDADVVVTATTSAEPVFPGDALAAGALVVAVGAYTPEMRELDATTMQRAGRIFADVPEEAAETGDVADAGLTAADLTPFGALLAGEADPTDEDGVTVVESVGSAVLDAAAVDHLLARAVAAGVGTTVEL